MIHPARTAVQVSTTDDYVPSVGASIQIGT